MRQLRHKVGLGKGSQLVDAVDWIRKYHILNNNRTFADELVCIYYFGENLKS